MRHRTASLLAAVLVVGLIAGPTTLAATSRPALKMLRAQPFTVRGTGFHRHERVRLTLRDATGTTMRRVTASAKGAFTVTFPTAKTGRCGSFAVRAAGALGSRATLRRPRPLPACNPV